MASTWLIEWRMRSSWGLSLVFGSCTGGWEPSPPAVSLPFTDEGTGAGSARVDLVTERPECKG
jgi:hypothetical protein